MLKPGTLIIITNIHTRTNGAPSLYVEHIDMDCDTVFYKLTCNDVNGLVGEIISHAYGCYPRAYIFALKAQLLLANSEFEVIEKQDA